jgi:hypothetical protein
VGRAEEATILCIRSKYRSSVPIEARLTTQM